jgi:phage FluMu gp28-like protein
MPSEYWQARKQRFMGLDFGRKNDLTVAWTLERIGDIGHTSDVCEMRGTSTPDQVTTLRPRILGCSRVCVDYTGPGVGLGDYLVQEFGEYDPVSHKFGKIELCTFTNPMKVDIFSKLRMLFEKRGVRIPVDRTIREDLHSVQRVTTAGGTVTYKAPHSADGHADRCTALALAVRAFGTGGAGALSAENIDKIRMGGSAPNRPMFTPSRFR